MQVPLLITRVSFSPTEYSADGTQPLKVILKCRDLNGDRQTLIVEGTRPALWVDQDPSGIELPDFAHTGSSPEFTSLEGDPLWEITVDYPYQRRIVAKKFRNTYSDDVPYEQAIRWMHGWRSVIEIDEKFLSGGLCRPVHIHPSEVDPAQFSLRCLTLDIETWDDIFHTPDKATGRVVSIAIHDSETGKYEIGTTAKGTSERLVKRMLSEQETLHKLVEHDKPIPPLNPSLVTVKSLAAGDECLPEFEDEETEAALFHWFKRRLKHYDPDVLIGHNMKGYDLPYMKTRIRVKNVEINKWKMGKRSSESTMRKNFPFIQWRDYASFCTMIAYSEQIEGSPVAAGMGSLAWMAGQELGYGKVPRTEIRKMFTGDPNLLAVYNVWDIVLCVRVIEKMDLIDFYAYKTAFHDASMDHSSSNMMLIESMLGHRLFKRGILMPSAVLVRRRIGDQKIQSGGFVSDARTGVWDKAFELDNSKEYPSAIITANLCPTTRIRNPQEYVEGYEPNYPFPVTITPNGTVYRRDRVGIMPEILKEMALGRDDVLDQMKEHEKGTSEWRRLNRRQRVMKENMNSFYGVLGSGSTSKTKGRPFRLADPQIASDITKIAQEHEHWNKRWLEQATLWFSSEDGVGVEPLTTKGSEMHFEVLYQDTDSCKCCISNLAELEARHRPLTSVEVMNVANLLSLQLNETFHDFCKQTLNVPRNEFFAIKPEEVYARYFQWGSKKRYAYLTLDGELQVKGVEMKRSSVAPVVKRVQRMIFESILGGDSKSEIVTTVRECNLLMLDSSSIADIEFGRPNGLRSDNHTTQQWKAATWSNQNLGTNFRLGDKPVLYFVSATQGSLMPRDKVVALPFGEDPGDWRVVIDRNESIRRFFTDSASFTGILAAVGVKWTEAIGGVIRADFGEFFG